jgi:hypothetical protein
MFSYNFDKILNLVKKTGDKVIVAPEFGDPFVIVPFKEYEKIVENKKEVENLSEEELWNQIDRDIAIWKEGHRFNQEDEGEPEFEMEDDWINPLQREEAWEKPWLSEGDEIEDKITEDFEEEKFEELEEEKSEILDLDDENLDDSSFPMEEKWDEEMEEKKNKRNRFAIPEERLHKNGEMNGNEPVHYENIPPPPDLNASNGLVEEEKPKIVDLSWEEGSN